MKEIKFKYVVLGLLLLSIIGCKKEDLLYDLYPNSELELPILIRFDNKDCFLDENSSAIKFCLDSSSIQNFNPFTEFNDESRVMFGTTELINNQINHFGTLEYGVLYPISIEYDNEIRDFTIEFTTTPMLRIVTKNDFNATTKVPTKITINYNQLDKVNDTFWAGTEYRGKSSLAYDKKSFGFRIYNSIEKNTAVKKTLFNMTSSEDWILDAMYIDQSRMRNIASFEIWDLMSSDQSNIAIKGHYIEVYHNNENLGLYSLNEDLSVDLLDLEEESSLYKGLDNSIHTKFEEVPDDTPSGSIWAQWEQVYPSYSSSLRWESFEELCKLIVESDDNTFEDEIFDHLEMGNVIDYYLFVNMAGAYDNVGKNWYFVQREQGDKFIIVPWDLDATWGKDAFGNNISSSIVISNGLFSRLIELDVDNFNSEVTDRWNELRLDVFSSSNLLDIFSKKFDNLKVTGQYENENKTWQLNLDPELEQNYIENWINERLAFLDDFFN